MGYFSNGSEGESYWATFCAKCIHREGPDKKSGCSIWLAHLLHQYRAEGDLKDVLDLLIPRRENGLGNKRCTMFVEAARQHVGQIPEHLREWADKQGIVEVSKKV